MFTSTGLLSTGVTPSPLPPCAVCRAVGGHHHQRSESLKGSSRVEQTRQTGDAVGERLGMSSINQSINTGPISSPPLTLWLTGRGELLTCLSLSTPTVTITKFSRARFLCRFFFQLLLLLIFRFSPFHAF